MITLFAALSAGAKTYIRCNFSIFFFNDLTERLGGCLYKCGCLVKLSILMSMTRKNSFFQSFRACTPNAIAYKFHWYFLLQATQPVLSAKVSQNDAYFRQAHGRFFRRSSIASRHSFSIFYAVLTIFFVF